MEREAKMLAEIDRLKAERDQLEGDWDKLPRLVFAFILVIPCGFLWGYVGVFFSVFAVFGLLFTAYYLVFVRRRECDDLIDELKRELRALKQ